MNIFAAFHERIGRHIDAIAASGRLPAEVDKAPFVVEPPRDASHGDLASNVAMVLAKEGKPHFANPRQLASEIAGLLAEDPDVDTAEVAGPGFLNIRLKPDVFIQVLREVLAQGTDFGRAPADRAGRAAEKVNVEYVSINPTGPMHVGHGRGAVFGDALATLLAFAGDDFTRAFYYYEACGPVD